MPAATSWCREHARPIRRWSIASESTERSKWASRTTSYSSSGCRRCGRSAATRCASSRSAPRAATCTRARCCFSPARRPTAALSSRRARSSWKARRERLADIIAGPGTLLGELALITEIKRPATATASEPSTVIRIPRSLFLKMLEGYPHAAHILRDQIVARAQQALTEMTDVRAMLDTSQHAAVVAAKPPASPSPGRGRMAAPSRAHPWSP